MLRCAVVLLAAATSSTRAARALVFFAQVADTFAAWGLASRQLDADRADPPLIRAALVRLSLIPSNTASW